MRIGTEHGAAGPLQGRIGRRRAAADILAEPPWYKTAVIYELHVRSFADSNADGIGDFPGLIEKLDYIQELGVTAIWLLPFYPSPLKDDGYDIADYYSINPSYGTLRDFERFMKEAHARGLRVITELVLNHTSDQSDWFQRSRRAAPGSVERDFYVWTDNPEKYKEVRIIFKDFEPSNWSWDPVAKAYYWHRFYSHQPDLNYDNPAVHAEIFKVIDFWLDKGVDGFRLDAVPYLYEREGTSGESLPETHEFLRKLRSHIDTKYGDRVLLAEANQWPEDSVAYFGRDAGDECHMAFHFPVMPRLFMSVRMEDRVPVVDILEQTPPLPETGQWALFLRNHDELTLEMVTDEERDFMYKAYAQELKARINLGIRRRLAPLLGNSRRKIELLNLLLLSLPGTPVIYYGDEIGMGDNIFLGDRNGVRTPMQWSSDKNAGFSRAHPNALFLPIVLDPEYHYETINVETQHRSPSSLLWWMRRTLHLRQRWKAFGVGSMTFLHPDNRKVLAYVRSWGDEHILVVANLSRFSEAAQLDLSQFRGYVPVEMYGNSKFPEITDDVYRLSLGPHSAYWLALKPATPQTAPLGSSRRETPVIFASVEDLAKAPVRKQLEKAILDFWKSNERSAAVASNITSIRIRDMIELPRLRKERGFSLIASVEQMQRESELHHILISVRPVARKLKSAGAAVIAHLSNGDKKSVMVVQDSSCGLAGWFLTHMDRAERIEASSGAVEVRLVNGGGRLQRAVGAYRETGREPLNSCVLVNERRILRLSHRLDPDSPGDVRFARRLVERFPHTTPLLASVDYHPTSGSEVNLAVALGWSGEHKTAHQQTIDALGRFMERARSTTKMPPLVRVEVSAIIEAVRAPESDAYPSIMGMFPSWLQLLGQRVAEMHLALAQEPHSPEFAPEEFTPFYQRSLYQSIRNHLLQGQELAKKAAAETPQLKRAAGLFASRQADLLRTLRRLFERPLAGFRLRGHGELELRNIVHTGKDYLIVPIPLRTSRAASERAIKRTPLRDAAFVLRSIQECAAREWAANGEGAISARKVGNYTAQWLEFWQFWCMTAFLEGYLPALRGSKLLPPDDAHISLLLQAHMVDRGMTQIAAFLQTDPRMAEALLEQLANSLCA